eukprot:7380606-Prymnesium_polylepis.6
MSSLLQRARERAGHKTLPASKAAGVVKRCANEMQPPLAAEGFDAVLLSPSADGTSGCSD